MIGQKIKELRQKKGLSQQKLADLAELSKALITHVESGKRFPSDNAFCKIKTALDSTDEEIFKEKTRMKCLERIQKEATAIQIVRAYRDIFGGKR